jgi:hypothetical protein
MDAPPTHKEGGMMPISLKRSQGAQNIPYVTVGRRHPSIGAGYVKSPADEPVQKCALAWTEVSGFDSHEI